MLNKWLYFLGKLVILLCLQSVKTNEIENSRENSFQLVDLNSFKFIINSGMLGQILNLDIEMMSLSLPVKYVNEGVETFNVQVNVTLMTWS